ncbi:MAG: maltooligosyltrehalose trehalohydrolase [Gaiellales bacterium]|nr:maltooligosyltrehalose trehalohydrolase [Gaiellales bacterium]
MRFRVWAPAARSGVELVLGDERHAMRASASGWWDCECEAGPGTAYAFAIDGGEARADPRALALPEGPGGRAVVVDRDELRTTDVAWAGVALEGSVIYELHVGTFTPEGTLDAAIERLDHLVALGVDIVEVMPLATFPGRHGWGYDGVGLYAVHEPYGGPFAFRRFVDACHERGLGVCLDVVYNHLGPSGNHLREFGPYFTDRYATPWGEAINLDGPGSDEVRRFLIDNALTWLRDFHVDALRLDAVHALLDERAITLLEELTAAADALSAQLGRPLTLIAESDRNDPLTVTPRDRNGTGFHGQWADDVHHALHVALTGEAQAYYADFATPGALTKVLEGIFLHDGCWSSFRERSHGAPIDRSSLPGSRFVVSLQTHDQVGNRAIGDRLSAGLPPGRLACGAALLLTSAGTPMLFMGEEWGASTPWMYFTDHTDPDIAEAVRQGRREEFGTHGWALDDVPDPQAPETFERSRLDWDEPGCEPHARLLAWYRNLIALRRARPDLRDPRLDRVRVEHDAAARTLIVHRGGHVVVVNLATEPRMLLLPSADLRVVLAWDPAGVEGNGAGMTLSGENAVVLGRA